MSDMNGDQLLSAYNDLAGEKGETTIRGTKEDAAELRKLCLTNGIEVDIRTVAPGRYRFTRREDDHATV